MKYSVFILCLALLLLMGCSRNAEIAEAPRSGIVWYTSIEEARKHAEAGGNLVLVSFEASWCPWSQLLHDSLFTDPTVLESLSAFKCARIDVDVDSISRREYGIELYPVIVITDAYGSELGRIMGYQDPPLFLEQLSPIKNRTDRISRMFTMEEMRRNDPDFLLTFGNMLFEMGVYDAALMRYEWASELDPDDIRGIREEAMYAMGECYMLSGRDKSAARTFRSFAATFPESERVQEAMVLAALCYERAGYSRAARDIYRGYEACFEDGAYSEFVSHKLEGEGQ